MNPTKQIIIDFINIYGDRLLANKGDNPLIDNMVERITGQEPANPTTKRYFKCFRCGSLATTEDGSDAIMCTQPCTHRTSGICGGAYVRIPEYAYMEALNEFNNIPHDSKKNTGC